MGTIKKQLTGLLSPNARRKARVVWYFLKRISQWPSARLHPWRRTSIRRLGDLANVHQGKRCFVIGNGPSLKETDVSKLEGEYTFGMNRVYLAFDDWGFTPSYLVSVNDLVIEQCAEDFRELSLPKFFSWRARNLLYPTGSPDASTHFLFTTHTGPTFAQDARGRMWEGATVTYVCLQLAFHMGFEKVILIGVDHSFSTDGEPNTTVISQGADSNHFSEEYFGEGFRWQLPDLETSEISYKMARDVYEKAGREIVDATIGGKLEVFPKVEYTRLF